MVIAVRGRTRANDSPMTTETAGAMNPASPSSRPLSSWNTLWTMLGARPPESPASIQTAATTGAAATNSIRAAGGIATLRDHRAKRSGTSADGLRGGDDSDAADDGERAENDEGDRVRRGRELDREACEQRAHGETSGEPDAAEDRAEPLLVGRRELDERCGERSGRRAAGDSLHDAARDDPADVGGDEEHEVRHELDDEGADQHGPSAEMIRQRSQDRVRRRGIRSRRRRTPP